MTERVPVSKKARFEVFKRDSFKCQYCGRSAPEIVLELDHIKPVAKGGSNEIMNLVTSCFDCNRGKSDRALSDSSVVSKQRAQLEELQERREQLEMMLEWRESLLQMAPREVDIVVRAVAQKLPAGHPLAVEAIRAHAKQWLNTYTLADVLEAIDNAGEHAWNPYAFIEKIPRFAGTIKRGRQTPYLKDLYYVRAIVRGNCSYCDDKRAFSMLREAYEAGADTDRLKAIARGARNWSQWRDEMSDYVSELKGGR